MSRPPTSCANYNPARLDLRPNVPDVRSRTTRARRDLAGYYAMIENLDWNYGRDLGRHSTQTGAAFNTHILFFADHGDMHGSHGHVPQDDRLRGGHPHPHDHRRRAAAAATTAGGPAALPVPLNHVDIAPTTLGLCGIAKPAWMEGADYSHYRLGGRPRRPSRTRPILQNVVPTGHGDSVNKP